VTDDPYDLLEGFFTRLFEPITAEPNPPSTFDWDPLGSGQIITRYSDDPGYYEGPHAQALRKSMAASTVNKAKAATASVENTAPASGSWTTTNETWKALDPHQKAAAMALLEAGPTRTKEATNVLASMVNRAGKRKQDLGEMVSSRDYQPTFERAQEQRLGGILKSPAHAALTDWVKRYSDGHEDDPTGGATHFIAHLPQMLALEAGNPGLYRSWRGWTKPNMENGEYSNVTSKDSVHSFLAPEGKHSVRRIYK
jgi:hypothetical protein